MNTRPSLSLLAAFALTLAACAPAANMGATEAAMDAMHADETQTAMESMDTMHAEETQTAMDMMHADETQTAMESMETMHATETEEAMQTMHAEETQTAMGTMGEMMTMSSGAFMAVEHQGSGTAAIVGSADGGYHLELTDFVVEDGPDLHVILTSQTMVDSSASSLTDPVDLGLLPAIEGDLSLPIPADADLSKVTAVVIWCEDFSVPFTYAPLQAP